MTKQELVSIINRLKMYATCLDEEDGSCYGCEEFCDEVGHVEHAEGCEWVQLQEDVKSAQAEA